MKLGMCTANLEITPELKQAGYAYIEMPSGRTFLPDADAAAWAEVAEKIAASALPVEACNLMLPPDVRIVGPERETQRAVEYLDRLFEQLKAIGCGIQVFGSGGARRVPDEYTREQGWGELVDFARAIAPLAERSGVTVVMEHLRAAECNILTTLAETADFVREVNHPSVLLLCDGYHVAQMDEPDETIRSNAGLIRHVHLADPVTRKAPTADSAIDGQMAALKAGGYDARMSVECGWDDFQAQAPGVYTVLAEKWQRA